VLVIPQAPPTATQYTEMKHTMEFNFGVMIDSSKSQEELTTLLLEQFPNATRDGGYIKANRNVLQLNDNFEYDILRSNEEKDGWIYYKYDLSVFPIEPVHLEEQRSLARVIISAIRGSGDRAELVAEFEE